MLALVPFSTCALKWTLHVPCPLCGMTRACLALVGGDFARASAFQPLVVPLAVLGVVAVGVALGAREERSWRAFARGALFASVVALLVVWVARFFGAFGGPVA
ncbi:MAG TPA: DUF2752 domain-containing protein [Polyangiaceae bacterium]|nr:DUF2752 domain-containing protein [Polyangiaceae bacterium]